MKTKYLIQSCLLLGLCIGFSGCVPSGSGHVYGFLPGFVHGLLLPIALIAKLIGQKYDLYAHVNTGFGYWLGFLLGFFSIWGSARIIKRF